MTSPARFRSRARDARSAMLTGVPETTLDQEPSAGEAVARTADAATTLGHRFEVFEAILLALAALLTAWSAFQATKWGGVQSDSYSRAGAARVESVRASNRADQLSAIDVGTFTSWMAAVAADERAGLESGLGDDGYSPHPGTESAFVYARMRPEFLVAMDAWLETAPTLDPDAPPTPFAMADYVLADAEVAAEKEQRAEAYSATARAASQDGDNYVMMTILFALVIVVVGIGNKMDSLRPRRSLVGLATVILVAAVVTVLTFPIKI